MLLCALWDMKPQELYDETGRRVTHFNDAMLRGKYVAQPDPSTSPRATTRCTALS